MKLTNCQTKAIATLTDWYDSEDQMITVKGPAGVGKTTALEALLERLGLIPETADGVADVLATAPTHGAKNVLRSKIKIPAVEIRTLCSALGLKPKNINGKLVFSPEIPGIYPNLPLLWIIDEVSQIGKSDWQHIIAALKQNPDTKLILVGDKFQIPPVNEQLSPAFGGDIQQITLKQVVRQERSPLKNFINWSREYAMKPKSKGFFDPQISHWNDTFEGSAIAAAEGEAERLAVKYALEGLLEEVDYYQIICQTNKTKKKINYEIRDEILLRKGIADPKDYYKGEIWRSEELILASRDKVLCGANASMKLLEVWPTTHLNFDCYEITAELLEEDKIITFKALAKKEETRHKKAVEKLKQKAIKAPVKTAWREYYQLKQAFANIQPPYVSNTYDCQGRTINTIAVLTDDFVRLTGKAGIHNKHLYTAFSRAKTAALYVRS